MSKQPDERARRSCARCGGRPRWPSASPAPTGAADASVDRALGARDGLRGSLSQGPDEFLAILAVLPHVGLDPARDVVDRHEESHLTVAQGVHHLAVAAADLEDALAIGDELDLGEMLVH